MDKEKKGKKIIVVDLDESAGNEFNVESLTPHSESSTNQKKKMSKTLKEIMMNEDMKFMNNFDPELSTRERRKLTRKLNNNEGKKNGTVCEENGALGGAEKDVCDCLIDGCPGCHFPCPKCRSYKCGCDCRVNRKWVYESIENEGDTVEKSTRTARDSSSAHS